ncbi:MAG: glycosyltransferase family 2 protein [Rhodoglobus sp.]
MTARSTIGIVTVTFNSAAVIDDFLESLGNQTHSDFRLYAVDNDSEDTTLAQLAPPRAFSTVVIRNAENRGFAKATNQGIRTAISDGCEWVLLLNNDTVLPASTLSQLAASAAANDARVVSPLIEAETPAGTVWYAGGHLRGPALAFRPVHEFFGRQSSTIASAARWTGFAPACCLLVHASVFRTIGLLDEEYFVYFEDIDFSIRARRGGIRYLLDARISILHKASSLTGGSNSTFTLHWMSRNWVLLLRRNSSPRTRPLGYAYILAWTIARRISRRDSHDEFRERLRGYREGLAQVLQATAPQAP